jgi:hypothetical protein
MNITYKIVRKKKLIYKLFHYIKYINRLGSVLPNQLSKLDKIKKLVKKKLQNTFQVLRSACKMA